MRRVKNVFIEALPRGLSEKREIAKRTGTFTLLVSELDQFEMSYRSQKRCDCDCERSNVN